MEKIFTVIASFFIMLCLGGVYSWSIFVPELKNSFNFSSFQTQVIFSILIAIFPITMIFAGRLEKKFSVKILCVISAIFFSFGYLLSGFSGGNFWIMLLGMGIFTGIGTGFGYLAALTAPVKAFPEKKGLVTGIAAAGFGLASVVLSPLAKFLLDKGFNVLNVFNIVGISYGMIILLFAFLINSSTQAKEEKPIKPFEFLKETSLYKLFTGLFLGTFAGLLIVGSLRPIGAEGGIDVNFLVLGVSVFSIANFLGRLFWGFVSDYLGSSLTIFIALAFQAVSIFLMGNISLDPMVYLILSFFIGFGFGSNFVLFARETSQIFGVKNLGVIYPYVFLGYSLGGIFGPSIGGFLHDVSKSYILGINIAAFLSFVGGILFLVNHFQMKGRKT